MNFYVAYQIQSKLPGAEVMGCTLEIYEDEKSFLIALQEYFRYLRYTAICNDLDRICEFPEEEDDYNAIIEKINERISKEENDMPPFSEGFTAYDTQVTIEKATLDYIEFFKFLCNLFTCKIRKHKTIEPLANMTDSHNEDIKAKPVLNNNDDIINNVSSKESLREYCCKLARTGELPNQAMLSQKLLNYAPIESDAIFLSDAIPVSASDEKDLAEHLRLRAKEREHKAEISKKKFQDWKESFNRDKATQENNEKAMLGNEKLKISEDKFCETLEAFLNGTTLLPELLLARRNLVTPISVHTAERLMNILEELPEGGVWPRIARLVFDPVVSAGDESVMYRMLEHIITRPRCVYEDDSWNLLGAEHDLLKETARQYAVNLKTDKAIEILKRHAP